MNVLILTPDRVGSTLLQRILTVYMLRREFDRPVINLHELTNGLIKYYNQTLNQEVLGKPEGTEKWGYFQSLGEVEDLLKTTDHYKTSRLAHYHIVNRKDSIADQIKFYEYLNKEFFIISCRRENLFEHALSWGINGHSKTLNVYSAIEKISVYSDIYKNGITIPEISFVNYLKKYKEYISWSDSYFNVQSYFNYDTDVHNIEDYILNLDFMQGHTNNTWKDMFGQDFNTWNACHRMLPNLLLDNKQSGSSIVNLPTSLLGNKKGQWDQIKGTEWPDSQSDYILNKIEKLSLTIKNEINSVILPLQINVTNNEYKFLEKNLQVYQSSNDQILQLVDSGFLVTGVPLKLQSLTEKKSIIKNFDQCIKWYNDWVGENNFGKPYTNDELISLSLSEEEKLGLPIVQQSLLQ